MKRKKRERERKREKEREQIQLKNKKKNYNCFWLSSLYDYESLTMINTFQMRVEDEKKLNKREISGEKS